MHACTPFFTLRILAMPSIAEQLAAIGGNRGALVSTIDNVLAELEQQGLAWRARLHPRHVGVNPANRGGWGITPSQVHRLGSDIFAMGWSPSATAHAVCAEDVGGACAQFTKTLQDKSDGMLGNFTVHEVRYGSLSCSHTNQWLVCVLAGVKCEFENISMGGNMSYEIASQQQPLKDALDHGMSWLVIGSRAIQMFPTLPDLVQAARNATGAVHQREDAFQMLTKIHSMAAGMLTMKDTVDWQKIADTVMRLSQ